MGFFGAGPTGTSNHGFPGGVGGTLGIEGRIASAGSWVLRLDGGVAPSTRSGGWAEPAVIGFQRPSAVDATLLSLMAGIRLGGAGRSRVYLDALAGIGFMNDPANTLSTFSSHPRSRDAANLAMSFGPGVELRIPRLPGVFADVHYDFYFVEGFDTPIVPVRIGLMFP